MATMRIRRAKAAQPPPEPSPLSPADRLILAIRARGSDASDLRDAAHEACHALEFDVPEGSWDRESIDKVVQRRNRKRDRSSAWASEILARAVEQLVCADLGVECWSVEKCVGVACMEAIKLDRINYDFDLFVRLVQLRMASVEAREMANRVEALLSQPGGRSESGGGTDENAPRGPGVRGAAGAALSPIKEG